MDITLAPLEEASGSSWVFIRQTQGKWPPLRKRCRGLASFLLKWVSRESLRRTAGVLRETQSGYPMSSCALLISDTNAAMHTTGNTVKLS